jgi:hypothetical protein
MTLDYTVHGQEKIMMINYVEEILTAFDKAEPKGRGTKSSAASENLFKIDEDCEKLQPSKAVDSTTWWQRLCMPPNVLGPIPAQLLHS